MKAESEELLRRSSLLKFLPPEHYEKLRALFREEHYDFGDLIISEGEEADAFYLLTLGRARVIGKTDNAGEEFTINVLRPGDEFGEAGLFGGPRMASVRCAPPGSAALEPEDVGADRAMPRNKKFPGDTGPLENAACFPLRVQQLRALAGADHECLARKTGADGFCQRAGHYPARRSGGANVHQTSSRKGVSGFIPSKMARPEIARFCAKAISLANFRC